MATHSSNNVVSISGYPTLRYSPTSTPLSSTLPTDSRCCGSRVDVDGYCLSCEIIAPDSTSYLCSTCDTVVAATSGEELRMECFTCGARWDDFEPAFIVDISTGSLHGIRANGWLPAKAPERITTYLQSYSDYLRTA
jgi:hypothetical protein